MYPLIKEGKAQAYAPAAKTVSRDMPVFYNPVMKRNRDIAILVLNSLGRQGLGIADPLAGTGIRSIRLLKELIPGTVKSISINEISTEAVKLIRKNLRINKIPTKGAVQIMNRDAATFLLESKGFDYIDIDPFGYPGPFLDAAAARISRKGILAVTATDTSALAGSSIAACKRKYWATPLRDACMHETGLRILIRFVQLFGAVHERALTPVYSYYHAHYIRAYFSCEKGKQRVDAIIAQHGMYKTAGPLWTGSLRDSGLAAEMLKNNTIPELGPFLSCIAQESEIPSIGFYHLPSICKRERMHSAGKIAEVIDAIKKKGYAASRTHFDSQGIRSEISYDEILQILRKSQ